MPSLLIISLAIGVTLAWPRRAMIMFDAMAVIGAAGLRKGKE